MTKSQWFLLETEQEYERALDRYQEVKRAPKNSDDYKEKLLLVHLISEYEKENRDLPEVDPIELIKIRMSDFGFKSADLANEYGERNNK